MYSLMAIVCVLVLLAPPGFAGQDIDMRSPQPIESGPFSGLRRPYQARHIPEPNYHDSSRLDQLVRAAKIYLSLDDAIALALENNLDIEVARYGQRIAEADLLRAHAGSPPGTPFTTRDPATVDPFFLGGWARALTQLFSRNFPDYYVGVQLNIPLRNRSAQSDAIRDELTLRQQELTDRKTRKQIKVDVQNAVIALQQAYAAYQTAVKSRVLSNHTLQGERRRFQMGGSTATILVEQSTGEILKNHQVILDEAMHGVVSRSPTPLPVLDVPNGRGGR